MSREAVNLWENFWPPYEDGRFDNLYNVEIYEGHHSRLDMDKIQYNRLHFIRTDVGDPDFLRFYDYTCSSYFMLTLLLRNEFLIIAMKFFKYTNTQEPEGYEK